MFVLGGKTLVSIGDVGDDMNNFSDTNKRYFAPYDSNARNITNAPFTNSFYCDVIKTGADYIVQRATIFNGGAQRYRCKQGNNWGSWVDISIDTPSFYKNYNSLQAFAGALEDYNVPKKEVMLSVGDDVILDETDTTGNAFIVMYNNSFGIFFAAHVSHVKQPIIVAERQGSGTFTGGLDSEGNFVYYYDNQYKLHLKYKSSQGHGTVMLTYIRFRDRS